MFVLTLKTFFFIILCLVFFKLFGIESIEKFFAQQTFVVESFRQYTRADNPGITVCATVNGATGWKNEKLYHDPFKKLCYKSTSTKEAYECIKNNTYDLSDIVYDATDGGNKTKSKVFSLERLYEFTFKVW